MKDYLCYQWEQWKELIFNSKEVAALVLLLVLAISLTLFIKRIVKKKRLKRNSIFLIKKNRYKDRIGKKPKRSNGRKK